MFYVKSGRGLPEITIPITSNNVYTRCPQCGKEMMADPVDVYQDENFHESSSIFCEECVNKLTDSRSNREKKCGYTRDALNSLVSIFRVDGYDKLINGLINAYDYVSIDDMEHDERVSLYGSL
jgi:uncharacterized CHY-type Zn-finger protein